MTAATMKLKKVTTTVYLPPEGYEKDLGEYGVMFCDASCGEPIAWGFVIRCQLGEERFNALGKYGSLECIEMGRWCLVVKWLSPEEATKKYGKVTNVERGPRGGFRSITYGTTRFSSSKGLLAKSAPW
jgi:hypothetical protein